MYKRQRIWRHWTSTACPALRATARLWWTDAAGRYLSLIHIFLAPGERITKEILNYIEYAKAKGCSMTGPEDPDILHLNVLA